MASTLSLVVILAVPTVAHLFRVAMPNTADIVSAVFIGVVSVAWRLLPRLNWTPREPPTSGRDSSNG